MTKHEMSSGEPYPHAKNEKVLYIDYSCLCGFHATTIATKAGNMPMVAKRNFANHVLASDIVDRTAEFQEGALIAQVPLKRGKPREYWVFHLNDPKLPDNLRYRGAYSANFNTQIEKARQIMLSAENNAWPVVPYTLIKPWLVVKAQGTTNTVQSATRTREEAVAAVFKILEAAIVKGYEPVTYESMDPMGVTAPLATVQAHLADLVDEYRNTNSDTKILEGLKKIAEVRSMMAVLDELEESLQSRLLGTLTDL